MKLATLEKIKEVKNHPNADLLDIACVLGYEAIIKRNEYQTGDIIIFIQPDTVLPDKPWAAFYKAKSGRVKAIRLRNVWSQGIVESPARLDLNVNGLEVGQEISHLIGVTKYEPPLPQDLAAKGLLPFGIPKTDEERWENIEEDLPYGELVDVTLKIDGQSFSAYCKLEDGKVVAKGILGRTMEYKLEAENNYTRNAAEYDVLYRLEKYCLKNNVSLCIRGESYGNGIQKFGHNPHTKQSLSLALFSAYLIDEHKYARKHHPYYIFDIAGELGLPTVPKLETTYLTKELIRYYSEEKDNIDGQLFEGVVINSSQGSFKIINKHYDSKK